MRPGARLGIAGLRLKDYGLAVLSLALFAAALISGEGPKSFAFLAAAAWWAAFATYWRRRALGKKRGGAPQTPDAREARRRAREMRRSRVGELPPREIER